MKGKGRGHTGKAVRQDAGVPCVGVSGSAHVVIAGATERAGVGVVKRAGGHTGTQRRGEVKYQPTESKWDLCVGSKTPTNIIIQMRAAAWSARMDNERAHERARLSKPAPNTGPKEKKGKRQQQPEERD